MPPDILSIPLHALWKPRFSVFLFSYPFPFSAVWLSFFRIGDGGILFHHLPEQLPPSSFPRPTPFLAPQTGFHGLTIMPNHVHRSVFSFFWCFAFFSFGLRSLQHNCVLSMVFSFSHFLQPFKKEPHPSLSSLNPGRPPTSVSQPSGFFFLFRSESLPPPLVR